MTISQTMLRPAKPETVALYTHGNFGKAWAAQRLYTEQLQRMKPASQAAQWWVHRAGHGAGIVRAKEISHP